jgi:hypothetical protein
MDSILLLLNELVTNVMGFPDFIGEKNDLGQRS